MKETIILLLFLLSMKTSFGQNDQNKLFESSKGKWKFPLKEYTQIKDGEIIRKNGVQIFDSTLIIKTNKPSEVFAVYNGRVVGSFEIDGEYTLVTQVGNYTISYSRLEKPTFRRNDQVKTGQKIGKLVNLLEDHHSLELDLHFMERKEPPAQSIKIKFSPYKWIDWKTAPNIKQRESHANL